MVAVLVTNSHRLMPETFGESLTGACTEGELLVAFHYICIIYGSVTKLSIETFSYKKVTDKSV